MTRTFRIFTVFTLFFLANCSWLSHKIAPEFPESQNFINRFGANFQAVVLFKFDANHPSSSWCKNKECFEVESSSAYKILMLEPGLYKVLQGDNILNFRLKQDKIYFITNNEDSDFEDVKKAFLKKDLKKLKKMFKNHKTEIEILSDKLNGDKKTINKYLAKPKVKTKKRSKYEK